MITVDSSRNRRGRMVDECAVEVDDLLDAYRRRRIRPSLLGNHQRDTVCGKDGLQVQNSKEHNRAAQERVDYFQTSRE